MKVVDSSLNTPTSSDVELQCLCSRTEHDELSGVDSKCSSWHSLIGLNQQYS